MKKLTALLLMCTMVFTLVACGGDKKTGTLSYDLPEGFIEQAEGQWVSPDYASGDSSNIIVQASENDPYGVNYTEDEFVELVSAAYEAQGYSIDSFNMVEFKKGELNGFDTLLIDCEYSLMGVEIQQIEFLAQIGDVTHVITYTTAPQFGWHDAFRASVDSMEIK